MRPPLLPAALLTLVCAAMPAGAATLIVNSTTDTTDGACGTAPGECTLREAIEAAVATSGHDTIAFDPTVFPRGSASGMIILTSSLPVIADPAGTDVDGAGATVVISGGGTVENGLVLASAPGVALASPRVARIRVQSVIGFGVSICGGLPPSCDGDVANARVEAVTTVTTGSDGIRIHGRNITKPQVLDSVVQASGSQGIWLYGAQQLVGARVERCTARQSGGTGILLDSGDAVVGSLVADSAALDSVLSGIAVEAHDVTKTRVTNCVAVRNAGVGVAINAGDNAVASTVSDTLAAMNGQDGILVRGVTVHTATHLQNVVGDGNVGQGIDLSGPAQALKVRRAVGIENADSGLAMLTLTAHGTKISDVVATGNEGSGGVLLVGTQCKAKRLLTCSNTDAGVAVLESSGCSIISSRSLANNSGISLRGTTVRNTVRKNVALGNTAYDLSDQNAACGPDVWAANVFRVGLPSCVH